MRAAICSFLLVFPNRSESLATSNTATASTSTTFAAASDHDEADLWGTDRCDSVACRFKAPNPQTPKELAQQWQTEDQALWSFVEEEVPDVIEHTGTAAFDTHLKGVQAVLRHWGAPPHLTKAGLFHSLYGTEGFQGFALPLDKRAAIQSLIGLQAEKLAFVFCMIDRSTFDQTVFDYKTDGATTQSTQQQQAVFQVRARPELGRFTIELTKEEWLDFVELTLADWLEQVEGAAAKPSSLFLWKQGQAYAYRRTAYQKMSHILAAERAPRLSTVAPTMLQEVMATEDEDSRHLLQLRTPPMSQAAADALAALRAAGEAVPDDLSPKPFLEEEECRQPVE